MTDELKKKVERLTGIEIGSSFFTEGNVDVIIACLSDIDIAREAQSIIKDYRNQEHDLNRKRFELGCKENELNKLEEELNRKADTLNERLEATDVTKQLETKRARDCVRLAEYFHEHTIGCHTNSYYLALGNILSSGTQIVPNIAETRGEEQ